MSELKDLENELNKELATIELQIKDVEEIIRNEESKIKTIMRENKILLDELRKLEKIVLNKRDEHLNLSDKEKFILNNQ